MTVPTAALRKARENAGIKQGEMAKLLGVSSNSVVSRLEKSEQTEWPMAERYLKAIGTEDSLAILDYYARQWRISKRPDFRHPDRDALWQAELALQSLEIFEANQGFDELLRAPLNFIRSTLFATAEYVGRTDHSLAWIGTVGIGKTTALSHLTNLVLPGPDGRPRPIFPASGGRTTTSEVVVRRAPAFGVAVDPRSEDDVRLLVSDLVEAVALGKGGIATELDRAVRNMAELHKRKNPNDPKALIDPIKEMIDASPDALDDVTHAIVARMRLEQRTETQMLISENNASGLPWVSEAVTEINFGKHAGFSLPQRVTVFVPRSAMRKALYDLTVIDTKGIHGATERNDLQALMNDPRTLSIICCAFNDAPGQEPLSILKGLIDLGSDAIERQRIVLLVLPRADEALKIIDDFGEPVESVEEGYAFRTNQIEDTLRSSNIPPVPVIYFNEVENESPAVWQELNRQVDVIRHRQLERLSRFTLLAAELQTNADAHRIQQARVTLAKEARATSDDYAELPGSVRPAQQRLLAEIRKSHASSIAAAVTREGGWYNLDMHHLVGSGVRSDAFIRSVDLVKRIRGRLDSLRNQFSAVPEAVALVDTLAEDLEDWHQEFLARSQTIGRTTFKPRLDADKSFWTGMRKRYGEGSGYREEIAERIDKWFDRPELNSVRSQVDSRLGDAWRELVLDKLVERTALEDETQE